MKQLHMRPSVRIKVPEHINILALIVTSPQHKDKSRSLPHASSTLQSQNEFYIHQM